MRARDELAEAHGFALAAARDDAARHADRGEALEQRAVRVCPQCTYANDAGALACAVCEGALP